jgi:type IV pilus assembly protein PilW
MDMNIMKKSYGRGFSLVELMVGMAIGLLATVVIMQVLAASEAQKRTTTGGADAQTNGNIAVFTVQREASLAGYGLPVFSTKNPALQCEPLPVHPTTAAGMFPVAITQGAAGASDTLTIRYGATARGGIPIAGTFAGTSVTVTNNLGCEVGDDVLIVNDASCAMQTVAALPDNTHITLKAAPAVLAGNIACMGAWNEVVFTTNAGGLTRNGVPSVADVVSFQAQYGLTDSPAAAGNSTITSWADAAATPPDLAMRSRIRAIRIALITRSGAYEKVAVSEACTPSAPKQKQPCIWTADATPVKIDLAVTLADANWDHYRYNVFEAIIPLRSLVWSSNTIP